ncbi:MAG: methylmalonyl Co-A mutase-associated GTPase MeaB [Candidatus Rokuibacteriota bacterium]|nr:MAG: methylmalonyl Co-A mutase-associated GTPase MeaB [Candidatus Rokubacteria bacterium]
MVISESDSASSPPADAVARMLDGDRLALARLITRVENRSPDVRAIMRAVHSRTGRAYVLGVTGPPGAGKSTLVDRLTALLRSRSLSVGIIAVDPSSPFTGGAVLGDRIRMQAHTLDPGVFIRSMATRGSLGGLAGATGDVNKLMDAFGFDWVIIETVGVGQTGLDVIRQADTTVVALVPESGDSVQVMKAGLLEAADVFVVNKADRDGAHALMAELKFNAHLHYTSGASAKDIDWEIPVLAAQAVHGVGIAELLETITRHRTVQEEAGALETRRRARRRAELEALLVEEFTAQVMGRVQSDQELVKTLEAVSTGSLDPYSAIDQILGATLRRP